VAARECSSRATVPTPSRRWGSRPTCCTRPTRSS
jgi:hypothetical protein